MRNIATPRPLPITRDEAVGPRARSRVRLIEVAERLFAEHGVDNVSLRQIAAAAGYSNTTSVQYHFGSKDGLCAAIIEHRLAGIDARTEALLALASTDDLDSLVDAMVRPMLEHDPESNYIGFLNRFLPSIGRYGAAVEVAMRHEAGKAVRAAIEALLDDVAPQVRRLRMSFATTLMIHAIAERSHWIATLRARGASKDDFERELMASIVAILRGGRHVV